MVKIDQEKPLIDYHSFIINQPSNFAKNLKAFQNSAKNFTYYAGIILMPYAFQSLSC